eukprot:tig00000654_g2813.t1
MVGGTQPSSSGEVPGIVPVGDVTVANRFREDGFLCVDVPTPLVLSAVAMDPTIVSITASFADGFAIAALDIVFHGPGAPPEGYKGSASVLPEDAAGAVVSAEVMMSYAGPYNVSCSVAARSSGDFTSPLSDPVDVTVPAGNSIAAQSALMPSGNTGASNTFLRVGNTVASEESDVIVFAVPLANYLLGRRPASHRIGFISRRKDDFLYCDFDLDSNRCSAVLRLTDVSSH